MTPTERKNYIANRLLKGGVNKNIIIGMLCNCYQESKFDPKAINHNEKPIFAYYPVNSYGIGLWQWSYLPTNKMVYDYFAGHTDKECIDMQVALLLRNSPSKWQAIRESWRHFYTNVNGYTWQQAVGQFLIYWEGGGYVYDSEYPRRVGWYSKVMPIDWETGSGGSTGTITPPANDPNATKQEDKKKAKDDCGPIGAENKHDQNTAPAPVPPVAPPKPANVTAAATALFNRMAAKPTVYYMPLRARILTDLAYSDCSAFVSRCLELMYGSGDTTLYNTESIRGLLTRLGYKMVYKTGGSQLPAMQAGDVIIMGAIGTSLGADGHVIMMEDSTKSIECHGSSPAMRRANAQSVVNFDRQYWDGANWYLYVWRHV